MTGTYASVASSAECSKPESSALTSSRCKLPRLTRTNPERVAEHATALLQDFDSVKEFSGKNLEEYVDYRNGSEYKQRISRNVLQEMKSSLTGLHEDVRKTIEEQLSDAVVQGVLMKKPPDHNSVHFPKYLFERLHRSVVELVTKIAPEAVAKATLDKEKLRSAVLVPTSISYTRSEQPKEGERSREEQSDDENKCCVCGSADDVEELLLTKCCSKVVGFLCYEESMYETMVCCLCREDLSPRTELINKNFGYDRQYKRHFETHISSDISGSEQWTGKPQPRLTARFVLRLFDQRVIQSLRIVDEERLLGDLYNVLKNDELRVHAYPKRRWFSDAKQLESGDVEVFVDRQVIPNMKLVNGNTSWGRALQDHLLSRLTTYDVRMDDVRVGSMELGDGDIKIKVLAELVGSNASRLHYSIDKPEDIPEIRWLGTRFTKRLQSSAILTFSDATQANQVIAKGLHWDDVHHHCMKARKPLKLKQCTRCQQFGHIRKQCPYSVTCSRCGGGHGSNICTKETFKCALCGGAHGARQWICPSKKLAQQKLIEDNRFYPEETEA